MRRVLFGFLGGVGATCLAFSLFHAGKAGNDQVDDPAMASDVGSSTPRASDNTQDGQEDLDQGSEDGEVAAETIARTQALALPEGDSSREARLRRELDEIQQVFADLRAERDYLLRAAAGADGPVVSPISLPPEFDWVSENTYRELWHERMQREYIDGEWASATQTRLSSFIYERPEIVQKYGAPTIRCHTTQCEVTFLAHGISDDAAVAMADARALFDDSFEEMNGLFVCGPGECRVDANNQDGVVTIFWAMTRNEQRTQDSSTFVPPLK